MLLIFLNETLDEMIVDICTFEMHIYIYTCQIFIYDVYLCENGTRYIYTFHIHTCDVYISEYGTFIHVICDNYIHDPKLF